MIKESIGTVVNFSTNEIDFLEPCLKEARHFSKELIVVAADHFFDGSPENRTLLNATYLYFPEVQFVEYALPRGKMFYSNHSAHFWHDLNRLIGFYYLRKKVDYLFFLDVDEIIEGEKFRRWLERFPVETYNAIELACYWYFRTTRLQAQTWESSPLLVRSKQLDYDALMHPFERKGTLAAIQGAKRQHVVGEDAKPMVHHYSWVRNPHQMLKKVASWGHAHERDWSRLVHEELSKPFSGKDFVHGYTYNEVEPFIELTPLHLPPEKGAAAFPNVTLLSEEALNAIDLEIKFP